MKTMTKPSDTDPKDSTPAERALAEAAERKKKQAPKDAPKEFGGPKGPDPIRFGDWEKKGIASDF